MKSLYLTTAILCVALGACRNAETNEAANVANATAQTDGNYGAGANGSAQGTNYSTTTTAPWPTGARIVVEDGITYRISPDGVRVALGPSDSRIVVENGVRYRVDPGGTRVQIDPEGAVLVVDPTG